MPENTKSPLNEQELKEIQRAYDAVAPMVLRDFFAGCVVMGILAGRKLPLDQAKEGSATDMAESAFVVADEMLRVRGKPPLKVRGGGA